MDLICTGLGSEGKGKLEKSGGGFIRGGTRGCYEAKGELCVGFFAVIPAVTAPSPQYAVLVPSFTSVCWNIHGYSGTRLGMRRAPERGPQLFREGSGPLPRGSRQSYALRG